MRKINIKSFILGFLIAAALFAIPAIAENIDAFMGTSRININGVDRVSWGEEIDLGDDWYAPYTINYKDTLYLPMRKISELTGMEVYWNGDTNTVSVVGALKDKKVVAEREDSEGNLWEYATYTDMDGYSYLKVTDASRGYSRVYLIASGSVRAGTDAIYFMRLKEHNAAQNQGVLVKLPYASNADSQDGETLYSVYPITKGNVAFDGDVVFYAGTTPGNGTHGQLTALNYATGKDAHINGEARSSIYDLNVTEDGKTDIVEYTMKTSSGDAYRMRAVYDRTAGQFGEAKAIAQIKD